MPSEYVRHLVAGCCVVLAVLFAIVLFGPMTRAAQSQEARESPPPVKPKVKEPEKPAPAAKAAPPVAGEAKAVAIAEVRGGGGEGVTRSKGAVRRLQEEISGALARSEGETLVRTLPRVQHEERELVQQIRQLAPEVARYLEAGGPDARFVREDWEELRGMVRHAEAVAVAGEHVEQAMDGTGDLSGAEARQVVRTAKRYVERVKVQTRELSEKLSILRNLIRPQPLRRGEPEALLPMGTNTLGDHPSERLLVVHEVEPAVSPDGVPAKRGLASHGERLLRKWGK